MSFDSQTSSASESLVDDNNTAAANSNFQQELTLDVQLPCDVVYSADSLPLLDLLKKVVGRFSSGMVKWTCFVWSANEMQRFTYERLLEINVTRAVDVANLLPMWKVFVDKNATTTNNSTTTKQNKKKRKSTTDDNQEQNRKSFMYWFT